MGRGDKDDAQKTSEVDAPSATLDDTAEADKADLGGETSLTAGSPSESTVSKRSPAAPAAKTGAEKSDAKTDTATTRPATGSPAKASPEKTRTEKTAATKDGAENAGPEKGGAAKDGTEKDGAATLVDKAPLDKAPLDKAPVEKPRPEAPSDDPVPADTPVAGHRRGPGLWLPLIVFVVLLAGGAIVGRFVVPGKGPDAGAVPQAPGGSQPAVTDGTSPDASLPLLPTPPVRPADQLQSWAEKIASAVGGVPPVAVQAYGYAQLTLQNVDPSCHLSWTTLAGIGEVESTHGQVAGAVLQPGGRSEPIIVGPAQDGQGGRTLVQDTDAGAFDGDATYDRGMGPLRIMPTVWREFEIDADADGIQDPFDIDDASMALARHLCSGNENLEQLPAWNTSIGRHHAGDAYAKSVFQAADGYGQRSRSVA